jgi:membrane-bound serine protease (ClpP class)
MVDSERYLDEVGRGLSLGHYEADAILLELRQHIEATKDRLQRDGLPRDEAVMAAVNRLGPARQLAHDLMAARRTRRRVVADVGGRLRLAATAFAFALGVAGSVLWSLGAAADEGGHVDVLPTTGVVDNVMAGYIADGIARAAADGAKALIIKLNTPGGSLDATQKIVSSILESPVPIITWVAPQGGRAASAGTFITLAGNLALMAPGTNIGAASPVDSSGGDIGGTLGEKIKNDAIANIRSIAETRGRNVDWAVSTVASARSSPASEAVSVGAVDGIAATVADVLAFADRRQVTVNGTPTTLDTAGASVSEQGMNPLQQFLHLLSDPNVAFILFTIGFYGLLFELMHPNFVTGIIGGLALILAFIGSGSLPLNVAGVILLGLSVVLLFLEASVPSHGLLTIAGVVCFVLGAATFYTAPGPGLPDVQVSWPIVAVMATLGALFALVVLRAAIQTRRAPPLPVSGFGFKGAVAVGAIGEVHRTLDPDGMVYVAGEEWSARAAGSGPIPRGTQVRVIAQDGLVLVVEPLEAANPTDAPTAAPALPA